MAAAKKPDSAFPSRVWEREKELLSSLPHEDKGRCAGICLELARLFKDNGRELEYLDMAEQYAASQDASGLLGTIALMRLEHYAAYEDSDLFLEYSREVKGLMAANRDERLANVEYVVIKHNIDEGRTQTALLRAEEMLERAISEGDAYMESYANLSIGLIYAATGRFYEATAAFEKAIALMTDVESVPRIDLIKAYLEVIYSQYSIGRYSESLRNCALASELLADYVSLNADFQEEINRRSMKLYILCCSAINYVELNETGKARRYLDLAHDCLYPSIGLDLENYHEACARYYLHTGEYEKAMSYIEKSVIAFGGEQLFPYYLEALELQTEILAASGQWDKAYANLAFISHAEDSLNSYRLASELSELHTIYEVDKVGAQKKRQQSFLLFSLTCSFLLAVIVIIYIVYSSRLRIKNRSLYEQISSNLRSQSNSTEALRATPEDMLSREMRLFRRIAVLMDEEHPFTDASFNRSSLSKAMGTNDKYVADAVRAGAGLTVAMYISNLRLSYSLGLLTDEEYSSLDEVAIDSGFGSYSSFFRAFQKKYSISPSDYRNCYRKGA